MSETKRDKKAEREQKRAEKEAIKALEAKDAARKRNTLLAVPAVVLALAAAAWFGLDDRSLAAGVLFAGMIVWLMVSLGFLGSSIPARDRLRASGIGFGKDGRRGS